MVINCVAMDDYLHAHCTQASNYNPVHCAVVSIEGGEL